MNVSSRAHRWLLTAGEDILSRCPGQAVQYGDGSGKEDRQKQAGPRGWRGRGPDGCDFSVATQPGNS